MTGRSWNHEGVVFRKNRIHMKMRTGRKGRRWRSKDQRAGKRARIEKKRIYCLRIGSFPLFFSLNNPGIAYFEEKSSICTGKRKILLTEIIVRVPEE